MAVEVEIYFNSLTGILWLQISIGVWALLTGSVETPIFLVVGEGGGHGIQSLCSVNMELESGSGLPSTWRLCVCSLQLGDLAEKIAYHDTEENTVLIISNYKFYWLKEHGEKLDSVRLIQMASKEVVRE